MNLEITSASNERWRVSIKILTIAWQLQTIDPCLSYTKSTSIGFHLAEWVSFTVALLPKSCLILSDMVIAAGLLIGAVLLLIWEWGYQPISWYQQPRTIITSSADTDVKLSLKLSHTPSKPIFSAQTMRAAAYKVLKMVKLYFGICGVAINLLGNCIYYYPGR